MNDDEGAFVKAVDQEARGAMRDFLSENTAFLLAFADGQILPTAEHWAKARARVAQIMGVDTTEVSSEENTQ